jgi:hypothetical protein
LGLRARESVARAGDAQAAPGQGRGATRGTDGGRAGEGRGATRGGGTGAAPGRASAPREGGTWPRWGASRGGQGVPRGGRVAVPGRGKGAAQGRVVGKARGAARGRRKGRERERGRGRGSSPWDPKSGDNCHRITPRARGGKEVEERERERELLHGKNQMRERERGHAWGDGHQGRAGRAGPGRAELGQVGLGCVAGQKLTAHPTTDRNPTANQKPETRRDGRAA